MFEDVFDDWYPHPQMLLETLFIRGSEWDSQCQWPGLG